MKPTETHGYSGSGQRDRAYSGTAIASQGSAIVQTVSTFTNMYLKKKHCRSI